MRRGSIASLVGIGIVSGGIAAAVALALPWLPVSASKEAGRIDFEFWFVITICIVIFAVVAAAMLYSIVRFRAAPDDDSDGPPIHGNTALEITWTLIPTVLVTAIGITSAIVLSRNDALAKNVFRVEVVAQQFTWTFKYPSGLTSATLDLPKGRETQLRFQSRDVIHAFFVPEFRENMDIVPGLTTTINVTPTRVGTYPVICNELCGLGHAMMRSTAVVMEPAAFDKWVKAQSKAVASPNPSTAGAAIFKNNGCGACHALAAAGASGKVGPDLDKLPAEAQQAGKPLAAFVQTSITDPNAYVQPGYPKNVMPQTFGKALSKQQLASLVSYLISSSKGK
jgi:cytochrome c oxidase subunit II